MALHIKKAGILSEILSHIYDLVNSHKGKSQKKISVKVGITKKEKKCFHEKSHFFGD